MKINKNLYLVLILCSYPISNILLIILNRITRGQTNINENALTMITISIIVFSILKYKDK